MLDLMNRGEWIESTDDCMNASNKEDVSFPILSLCNSKKRNFTINFSGVRLKLYLVVSEAWGHILNRIYKISDNWPTSIQGSFRIHHSLPTDHT